MQWVRVHNSLSMLRILCSNQAYPNLADTIFLFLALLFLLIRLCLASNSATKPLRTVQRSSPSPVISTEVFLFLIRSADVNRRSLSDKNGFCGGSIAEDEENGERPMMVGREPRFRRPRREVTCVMPAGGGSTFD